MSLKNYSTEDLKAEIRRRERDYPVSNRQIIPCDLCKHFIPMKGDVKDYNPCELGHKMKFRAPEGYEYVWGFYKPKCRDRVRIDVAPIPTINPDKFKMPEVLKH